MEVDENSKTERWKKDKLMRILGSNRNGNSLDLHCGDQIKTVTSRGQEEDVV